MEQESLEIERQRRLSAARRVVVKLGTNTVTAEGGEFCNQRVEPIVRSISNLLQSGRQVVLVSSGAVGLGAAKLGLSRSRLSDVVVRQACASVGQGLLMYSYEKLFNDLGIKIAQVLLTEDDFSAWPRYVNLRRTMEKLLKLQVVPIVNENDTVSTAELEYLNPGQTKIFSDNDRLAALVMSKLEADALVILSNVDGLLRIDSEKREVIPVVTEISPEIRALASGPSGGGRGGMVTKLDAAQIAMRAGGLMVIANGNEPDVLDRIFNGDPLGTVFVSKSRISGKKRWIAYAADIAGRVVVNEGARDAILNGKASLLFSGVIRIERAFESLDVVSITDQRGQEIARGIANFSSLEAEAFINGSSDRVKEGPARSRVLVTRDNIVVSEQRSELNQANQ
jgi:glutamate 5-kinase